MAAKLVHFWGRVQGVGFRHKAWTLAQGFPVAGFVRNLADGQVELWAEGDDAEVRRYLDALCRHMAAYIAGKEESDEAERGLGEFSVRG